MRDQYDRRAAFDLLRIHAPAVLLVVIAFSVAYQFVDPAPPDRIVIATGSPDGAYARFAHRYREILARVGVTLEVRNTAGSVENLALLDDPDSGVDVAFMQGGLAEYARSDALESLASLFYEPMWLFHREGLDLERIADLRGARVAIGPQGSGTRSVALTILADNGLDTSEVLVTEQGGAQAAALIEAGELDAVFVIASPRSDAVVAPLRANGVTLMSLDRAEAYARHHRFVTAVTLPEGALDLERNLPGTETALVATAASLAARDTLHPALVDLLLQAADEVHRVGGVFERRGEFPSPALTDFPLSDEARRFFDSGPPFLRRTLPFWAATLVDRLLVMLLPLIAIAIPAFRLMPGVYRWRMRSRIYRWYKRLRPLEDRLRGDPDDVAITERLRDLEEIEREVEQLSVPWSFADELYQLRLHIDMVRGKLERVRDVREQ